MDIYTTGTNEIKTTKKTKMQINKKIGSYIVYYNKGILCIYHNVNAAKRVIISFPTLTIF